MRVLDTNTISYFFRGDPQVVPRLLALSPAEIAVPTVVVYELRYGLLRLPREAGQRRLQALEQLLRPVRLLPFDPASAEIAAEVRVELERRGTPIGAHDLLIAATALSHTATLVTRNVREFSRIDGLKLENWHQDA